MRCCRPLLLAALLGAASPASAAEPDATAPSYLPEVHAFVSQGALKSTGNNYLVDSRRGSFELTEVGINFTATPADRLRVGLQLFGGGFGTGRYNAKTDWFYLDYHWRDWLGIRAGRVKIPFGLYNEINDVDQARVSVLLPPSIYPATSRNFLLAQTGGEIYGYLRLAQAGALEYRLYGGTILIDASTTSSSSLTIQSLTVPYLAGGRLMYETPLEGLRLGGSLQALRIDGTASAGMMTATFKVPYLVWIGSVEYARYNLLLAAEYSRWHLALDSNDQMLFPNQSTESEAYYGLASYRLSSWLQVGSYYSGIYPNVDVHHGRAAMQHDVAATLRFDINANWLVKLEGHFIHGTATLSSPLNDNKMLSQLPQDWALFLIKTTAYF